jgi:hypothetical protein
VIYYNVNDEAQKSKIIDESLDHYKDDDSNMIFYEARSD